MYLHTLQLQQIRFNYFKIIACNFFLFEREFIIERIWLDAISLISSL